MPDTRVVFDRMELLLEAIDFVRYEEGPGDRVVAWFGPDRRPLRASELKNIYGDWLAGCGRIPAAQFVDVGTAPPSPIFQDEATPRDRARPKGRGARF